MDISRRQFIKKSGLLLGSSLLFCVCPISFSLQANEKYFSLFSELSAQLTANNHLSPALMRLYYNKLLVSHHDDFTKLLDKAQPFIAENNLQEFISSEFKQRTAASDLIKKIIKVWYLGCLDNKTPSASAYQEALIWKTFASSAPGTPNGNAWDVPPPSIS